MAIFMKSGGNRKVSAPLVFEDRTTESETKNKDSSDAVKTHTHSLISDKSERLRRLSICKECPEKMVSAVSVINVDVDRCGKCKCLLATRVYTSCPIGKW